MKGFTLIEILVIVGIIFLLAVIGFSGFVVFSEMESINSSIDLIISALHSARTQTLSSKQADQYGVHFENNKIVIFKGTAYNPSDPSNKEKPISSKVEISSISLAGGGQEVIFNRFSGNTAQPGTVTVHSKRDPSKTKTIAILPSGITSIYTSPNLFGDLDFDCDVDADDLAIVTASLGKCSGDTGFNPIADVNSDGCVDILDSSAVSTAMGSTC